MEYFLGFKASEILEWEKYLVNVYESAKEVLEASSNTDSDFRFVGWDMDAGKALWVNNPEKIIQCRQEFMMIAGKYSLLTPEEVIKQYEDEALPMFTSAKAYRDLDPKEFETLRLIRCDLAGKYAWRNNFERLFL